MSVDEALAATTTTAEGVMSSQVDPRARPQARHRGAHHRGRRLGPLRADAARRRGRAADGSNRQGGAAYAVGSASWNRSQSSDRVHRKIRVAVLFGGRSTEHSISCITAGSVLAALDRERYDVVPIGITREGRWVLSSDDPAEFEIHGGELPEVGGVRRLGRARCRPDRTRARGLRTRRRPARSRPTSTSCSRCCTGRTARTARSKDCSSSQVFRTSAPACFRLPPLWTSNT